MDNGDCKDDERAGKRSGHFWFSEVIFHYIRLRVNCETLYAICGYRYRMRRAGHCATVKNAQITRYAPSQCYTNANHAANHLPTHIDWVPSQWAPDQSYPQ